METMHYKKTTPFLGILLVFAFVAVMLPLFPSSAHAVWRCQIKNFDIGDFWNGGDCYYNNDNPGQAEPDPAPVFGGHPVPQGGGGANLAVGSGTAEVCSDWLQATGVIADRCVVLPIADAVKAVQQLIDIANAEAGGAGCAADGPHNGECSGIPPPTITYDAQGRITYVACGNGGATASITYSEPAPPSPGGGGGTPDPNPPVPPPGGGGDGGGGGGGGGAGGGGGGGVPDAVNPIPVPAEGVSAVLTASPTSISQGAYSTLSWFSRNTTSCAGDGFDTGGRTFGTKQVTPLQTTLYTLTCTNAAGQSAFSTATVTVSGPALSIVATPSSIRKGDSTVVRWSATGMLDSCSVSGPGLSSSDFSGSQTVTIATESTYTLTCAIRNAASRSVSTTVKVLPSFIEQ